MGVNLYNSEGYLDLTAYEAIKNVEEDRKKKSKKAGGAKDDRKTSKDLFCIQKRKV